MDFVITLDNIIDLIFIGIVVFIIAICFLGGVVLNIFRKLKRPKSKNI